ncbi:MAG: SWIM zinc finger family protein [Bacteroidota bacterium]
MIFNYKYGRPSNITNSATAMGLSFAPDLLREPTFFVGNLNQKIPFREAMSALHDVVVSDLRFRPKDKTAYKEWAKTQEELWLAAYMADLPDLIEKIDHLKTELGSLRAHKNKILQPFYKARQSFFEYIRKRDYDAWFVLDPVITVHPDELFFECFSQDESTYARLGCDYNVFEQINTFECGTTNIDYSSSLYNEFQKIRTYKDTNFKIDPSGFDVQTEHEAAYKEEKIDLPDTWVRGFLQVSAAMTLPSVELDLHPMDLWNCLFFLKRNKAKSSPRYMKYILSPGQPIRILFEPWKKEISCPRSIYIGKEEQEIKIWGRRRLLTLERLLPIAQNVKIHLLGDGLPSFYIVGMDDLNFTLGLSGWTTNDWSGAGRFNLLGSTKAVDAYSKQQVYQNLRQAWVLSAEDLAQKTALDKATVQDIMTLHAQEGNAIYDLNKKQFRARVLSKDGIPTEQLRFVSAVEQEAHEAVANHRVRITRHQQKGDLEEVAGVVQEKDKKYISHFFLNEDKRIVKADCTCNHFQQNGLRKGPCAHLLALRMLANV